MSARQGINRENSHVREVDIRFGAEGVVWKSLSELTRETWRGRHCVGFRVGIGEGGVAVSDDRDATDEPMCDDIDALEIIHNYWLSGIFSEGVGGADLGIFKKTPGNFRFVRVSERVFAFEGRR